MMQPPGPPLAASVPPNNRVQRSERGRAGGALRMPQAVQQCSRSAPTGCSMLMPRASLCSCLCLCV
jgi:hypothetical protein